MQEGRFRAHLSPAMGAPLRWVRFKGLCGVRLGPSRALARLFGHPPYRPQRIGRASEFNGG
eukprot:2418476-Pyramimonas_sp.AAC.1